jgi:hypothetical protein
MPKPKKKKKKKKLDIFAILDAITRTKKDLTAHPEFEKAYNPFMVARWLSMNADTLMEAFFVDRIRGLDKKTHFRFLRSLVDERTVRFSYKKGHSASVKDMTVKAVMEYYEVGREEASEIVNMLTPDQLDAIEDTFGGRRAKSRMKR